MKKWFSHLKLTAKIYTIVIFSVLGTLIISIIATIIVTATYSKELRIRIIDTANTLTTSITNELSQVERVSLTLTGEPSLISYLNVSMQGIQNYNVTRAATAMKSSLSNIQWMIKNVLSINVIDRKEETVSVGALYSSFIRNNIDNIEKLAFEKDGSHAWLHSESEYGQIFSVRAVKRTENLTFENIGVLIVGYDIRQMIDAATVYSGEETLGVLISSEDGSLIYNNNADYSDIAINPMGSQLNTVKEVNFKGVTYYMLTQQLSSSKLYITSLFPLSKLTSMRQRLTIILSSIFAIIMLIETILIRKTMKTITQPIDNLVVSLKKVERNDLDTEYLVSTEVYKRQDEIGYLYRSFHEMMHSINYLIQENYKKQIVLTDTKYKALKAQVNPHFLYNTLDSINWMAKESRQKEISQMIEDLVLLLRNSISTEQGLIPLSKEIKILEGYVHLQKSRYEDRLQFNMQLDDSILDNLIPSLMLQVLVENSIKHGLDINTCICHINVLVKRLDEQNIIIEVSDDGNGIKPEIQKKLLNGEYESGSHGLGIKNILDRLTIDFNHKYTFKIISTPGKGTIMRFNLPSKRGDDHV